MTKSCKDCVFCGTESFDERTFVLEEQGELKLQKELKQRKGVAVCRINPPTGLVRMAPMFPMVDPDNDWCGKGTDAEGKGFL